MKRRTGRIGALMLGLLMLAAKGVCAGEKTAEAGTGISAEIQQ